MTSVSQLKKQKGKVVGTMSDLEDNVSQFEDKISRLRKASSRLESLIEDSETIQDNISDQNFNNHKWKGEEFTKFSEHYAVYEEDVETFVEETQEEKDTIDEEIEKYEQKKGDVLAKLDTLGTTLDDLDTEISEAEDNKKG